MSLFDFNEIQRKIIGVISGVMPDAKIYLFGSRARGSNQKSSDIDIALDTGVQLERIEVGEIRDMLNASNIPYKIDVVDFNNIPEPMQENIIKERIIWKS